MSSAEEKEAQSGEDTREEQLKQSLWLAIGRLVDDACMTLNSNATPQFIAALTEAVWSQIETAAVDVEFFARHAGRDVVGTEDVMLLARRNEVLQQLMRGRLEVVKAQHELATAAGPSKGKRKVAQN